MKKVLIVDDMDFNRELLSEMIEDRFEPVEASNGREALEILRRDEDDIVLMLLDVVMPEMNGVQVLQAMNEDHSIENIPVLIITGEHDRELEHQCFELGASDFILKPFDSRIVGKRVDNLAGLYIYRHHLEEVVARQTESLRKSNEDLEEKNLKLKENSRDIIAAMGVIVEGRDMESGEHVQRVKAYTQIIAEELAAEHPEMGLTEESIEVIASASPMHDVGKIKIPDAVLLKPGRLTDEEFDIMRRHTVYGCEILEQLKHLWIPELYDACYEICRHHHERCDGRGYPDGLTEDEIPISAQIVALADVYDALVSDRVYRAAIPKDQAAQMIMNGDCGTFSDTLLKCFRACRKRMEAMAR